jgi:hypothetical protein
MKIKKNRRGAEYAEGRGYREIICFAARRE